MTTGESAGAAGTYGQADMAADRRRLTAVVLTDEAVLPGESHVLRGHWDEEAALAAQRGTVVLLPRAAFHQTRAPWVGLLAAVDGRARDDGWGITAVRGFGRRRVAVLRVRRRRPCLLVEVQAIRDGVPGPADALRRLARLRDRLAAGGQIAPAAAHRSLTPGRLADRLALALDLDPATRLALLAAVPWPERLALLEALVRCRPGSRREPLAVSTGSDALAARVRAAKLPAAIKRAAERALRGATGHDGAPNREAAIDLGRARALLDASHAGPSAAKQAVLDYLAVLEWRRRQGGESLGAIQPNLCLVGPPGTGKTTLAARVAEAMGKRLERISLGGVDDVSLVGVDRVYRQSRPGGIVRRLRAAQVHPSQVVWLLDEIDKASRWSDHTAIPVLLALLDPSQNSAWQDHFLDGAVLDLSGSLFMATANDPDGIPSALRDRLRCVEVPGYSSAEQIQIGVEKLLPKLLRQLGADGVVEVAESVLGSLVLDHPRTTGCLQLEQRLQVVLARALELHMDGGGPVTVDARMAMGWVPPERSSGIGFQWQARLDSVAVAPGALAVGVGD